MNRRESLMALASGGLVAASNWEVLGKYLPSSGKDIAYLEFGSMADIGRFVEVVTGITCKIPGLYVVPNLQTEDGFIIAWNVLSDVPRGHCRLVFRSGGERMAKI